jgi:hypothetical protein
MEVSGQLHAPAALSLGKEHLFFDLGMTLKRFFSRYYFFSEVMALCGVQFSQ